jgi:hypothetical protein
VGAGCPQSWAYKEGLGCALLRKPESVRDLIRTTKQRVGWDFPVTVKVRVDPDLTCVLSLARWNDTEASLKQSDEYPGRDGDSSGSRHHHCAREDTPSVLLRSPRQSRIHCLRRIMWQGESADGRQRGCVQFEGGGGDEEGVWCQRCDECQGTPRQPSASHSTLHMLIITDMSISGALCRLRQDSPRSHLRASSPSLSSTPLTPSHRTSRESVVTQAYSTPSSTATSPT